MSKDISSDKKIEGMKKAIENMQNAIKNMSSKLPEKIEVVVAQEEFGGISVGGLLSYMLCELTQHIGQIAYIRGLQRGLNG